MTDQGRQLAKLVRDMIVERQRLLSREANYLRGLVGLPPVKTDKEKGEGGGRAEVTRAGGPA